MKLKDALFRVLFLAALGACLTGAAAAQTFPDVPESHWAYASIEEAAADGAVKGYSNGAFAPNSPLSLAHFTVILVRSFYAEDYNLELSQISSPYVEWYDAAQTVANDHRLLKGVNANMTDPLSRYQMATEIYNLLQSEGCEFTRNDVLKAFASIRDLDDFPSDATANAVACVYSVGILNGYSDGAFHGDVIPNRAQAAAIYCRLKKLLADLAYNKLLSDYGTLPNKRPSQLTIRDVYTPGRTTGSTFTFQGSKIPIYAGVERLQVGAGDFVWRTGGRLRYVGNKYDAWFGVDVSAYQNRDRTNGTINWKAAKEDGVQFAMIRVGLRGTSTGALREDPYYAKNIDGALAQGIQTGAYIFAQAINIQEAIEEADFVIERLRGHKINGPVSYDWEINSDSYRGAKVSKEMATACAVAFCKRVAAAGYTPMFYNSRQEAYFRYDQGALAPYMMWYPQYPLTSNSKPYPNLYYQMDYWQFTESGTVYGIGKKIDCDIWFKPKS